MLFRKKIQRSCSYCTHGVRMSDGQILCSRKGFRTESDSCWKFRYDPCKRIPKKAKAMDFSRFDNDNFTLDD